VAVCGLRGVVHPSDPNSTHANVDVSIIFHDGSA
jgi:hypothetical protein